MSYALSMSSPAPDLDRPTLAQYTALEHAFEHFNAQLFEGKLPACLLTLRSSPRTYGYLHARRFINAQGHEVDELALNPGFFALQSTEEVLATLVHEMVHLWQQHFGQPSRGTQHNRQWAEKMQSIGLMPSHTGLPGGRRTGQTMSDYILPNGPFHQAAQALAATGFALPWLDRHVPVAPERLAARQERLNEAGLAIQPLQPAPIELPWLGVSRPAPGHVASTTTSQEAQSAADPHSEPPSPPRLSDQLQVPMPRPKPDAPSRIRFKCVECSASAWAVPETELVCGRCGVEMRGV